VKYTALARGLAATPGAAKGRVVFQPEAAVEKALREEKVILVRPETSPEDVAGMHASQGVLTSRGGLTSHASVVARGMGKPCVVGAGEVVVDEEKRLFRVGRAVVREGQTITLTEKGEVVLADLPLVHPPLSPEFGELMGWARDVSTTRVRANADTPNDARKAREFFAEGIGLVRTEHMFFKEDRIPIVREMIMARDEQARRKAVDRLLPFQREDFIGIFTAMNGYPVTIRLLDPPLHEFLPKYKEVLEEYTRLDALGINPARHQELGAIKARLEILIEANPMLGHRGCRLGITFPEIYEMQVRAIMEAACEVAKRGVRVEPEIMIPLTGTVAEMKLTRDMTDRIAKQTVAEMGGKVEYSVGTMIEVPRAALIADKLAEHADFFSFGTNDLTQMTFGYSRDDIGKFLPFYLEKKLLPDDPFAVLDQEGVGEMIKIGIQRGRKTKPKLKVGICGEHGGEPSSVEFCHRVGMDYVSCSPYMVPIAWLASAQAQIKQPRPAARGRSHA
jgi:pyruvate,orthophosphate dikinase